MLYIEDLNILLEKVLKKTVKEELLKEIEFIEYDVLSDCCRSINKDIIRIAKELDNSKITQKILYLTIIVVQGNILKNLVNTTRMQDNGEKYFVVAMCIVSKNHVDNIIGALEMELF